MRFQKRKSVNSEKAASQLGQIKRQNGHSRYQVVLLTDADCGEPNPAGTRRLPDRALRYSGDGPNRVSGRLLNGDVVRIVVGRCERPHYRFLFVLLLRHR